MIPQLNYFRFCWQYRILEKKVPSDDISNILDLGCGDGQLVINFSKLFSNANVTGVDKYTDYKQSTERKVKAEKLIAESGLSKRCKIVEADAFELPFPEKRFDLIHARNSLHHMFVSHDTDSIREITIFFKNIKGFLKEDGFLVISEIGPVNYLSYARYIIPRRLFFINQAHNMDYKSKFPRQTWTSCLREAGFSIVFTEYYVPYRLRYFRRILAKEFFSRFSHSSFTILARRTK